MLAALLNYNIAIATATDTECEITDPTPGRRQDLKQVLPDNIYFHL